MKLTNFMASTGLISVVAARQLYPRQSSPPGMCCFTLTADAPGIGSAIVEEDTIGQNLIFSSYPDGFYCVRPGEPGRLYDSIGNTCIISPATQQFQCTLGLTSPVDFTISSEGHFQADGDNNFYACQRSGRTDDDSYLIFAATLADTTDCIAITLETTGDACAGGSGGAATPGGPAPGIFTVAPLPSTLETVTGSAPTSSEEPFFTIQTETSSAPVPTDYLPAPPPPPAGGYEGGEVYTATETAGGYVPPPPPSGGYEAPPPADDYVVTVTAGGYAPPPPSYEAPPPPAGGEYVVTVTAGGYAPPPPPSGGYEAPSYEAPPPPAVDYEPVVVTVTAGGYEAPPPPPSYEAPPPAEEYVVTVTETGTPYEPSPPPVVVYEPAPPPPSGGYEAVPPPSVVYVTVYYTEGMTTPPAPTLPAPTYVPGEIQTVTVYVTATYTDTPVPLPSPIKEPSSCPTDLSGEYRAPALIIPVSPEAPDAAYGTQFIAKITPGNSTLYSYDIPEAWTGKRCAVIFNLPASSDTVFPDLYKYEAGKANGKVQIGGLKAPIDNKVTYASKPAIAKISEIASVAPGYSYTVFEGSCEAGQRVAFEIKSEKGTVVEYFQATAPKPIGLWIVKC